MNEQRLIVLHPYGHDWHEDGCECGRCDAVNRKSYGCAGYDARVLAALHAFAPGLCEPVLVEYGCTPESARDAAAHAAVEAGYRVVEPQTMETKNAAS